jgi:hypothetical protein
MALATPFCFVATMQKFCEETQNGELSRSKTAMLKRFWLCLTVKWQQYNFNCGNAQEAFLY